MKAPKYARLNARRSLECINQGSKAMTEIGINRAKQLANNENLSLKDLKSINSFRRHKKNASYKGKLCDDKGAVACQGWGYSHKNKKGVEDFGDWAKKQISKYKK